MHVKRRKHTLSTEKAGLATKEPQKSKFYAIILISIILTGILSITCSFSFGMDNNMDREIITCSGTIAWVLPLHTEGRYIKDENGRTVQLYGVTKHGFEDFPQGSWMTKDGGILWGTWDPQVVADNLDAMKSWGCNIVRIYATVEFWINNETHRQCIKDLITIAGQRGMYVSYGFWRIMNHAPQTRLPYPPWCEDNPYISSEQDFVDLWVDVATQLKDYPNVLFELWNEPGMGTTLEALDHWFDVAQDCIVTIRQITDHIIQVQQGCTLWAVINSPEDSHGDVDWITDPRIQGTNIVYTHHSYGEWRIWDNATSQYHWVTDYDSVKTALEQCKVRWCVEEANKPFLIQEIGPNLDNSNVTARLNEYTNTLDILNDWQIGYIGFYWWPAGGLRLLEEGPNFPPSEQGITLMEAIANAT
jgi:hypothetical protein